MSGLRSLSDEPLGGRIIIYSVTGNKVNLLSVTKILVRRFFARIRVM